MSEIAEKVKAIIVEKLSVDAADVREEASFTNDLGADSLETVELMMDLEKEFLHLDAPFEQWVTRQKRRSKLPRDTTARRVKAASRKAHPLAFTRNTLCTKFLQRILTRIHEVISSHINHLLSIDCKRKSTR